MSDEIEVVFYFSCGKPIEKEKRDEVAYFYSQLLDALTEMDAPLPHKVAFTIGEKVVYWELQVLDREEFLRTQKIKYEGEQPPKNQQQVPRWRLWDFAKKKGNDDNRRT